MERKHVDFVTAIGLLALSVYVIVESIGFYNEINRRMTLVFHQSPGFYTSILGVALFICSLLLLIRSLKGSHVSEHLKSIKSGAVVFFKSPNTRKAFIGCAWMGLYIYFLLPFLSFLVGTIIFLFVLIMFLLADTLLGADKKTIIRTVVKIFVISTAFVWGVYGLFQLFFRVPLP